VCNQHLANVFAILDGRISRTMVTEDRKDRGKVLPEAGEK